MAYLGVSPSNGVRKVHTYTATSSQTTFSGAGAENISLSYRDSTYIDVYQNGVKLGDADYTATSGTSVVLGTGATASDIVVIVVYDVFSVADTVSKTDGGQFDGNVTMGGTLDVSGAFTSQGIDDNADATAITIDSTERVGIGETSPQTKLHIKTADASATADSNSALVIEGTDATRADLQFLGDAGAFQAIYFGDNSDADIGRIAYDHTGNSMRFTVNASERMRINNDGNVLIGRTSELTDFGDGRTSLVLQGTGSQDYSTIQIGNNGTASNTQILGILAFYDGTENNARVQSQRESSTDSGNLIFSTRPASGSITERMRILSNGVCLFNKTADDNTSAGATLSSGGNGFVRDGGASIIANRLSSDGEIIRIQKDGSTVGQLNSEAGRLVIASSNAGLRFDSGNSAIFPRKSDNTGSDNLLTLGLSNHRFSVVFAFTGTINTSDRNEKQDIEEISEAEKRVAVVAKGLIRKFKFKDAVAKKGDKARTHFGIIAQDLEDAFKAEGLDASKYAMFCSDTWWEKEEKYTDDDGKEKTRIMDYEKEEDAPKDATKKTRLGVRYSELLAFIILAI